VEKDLSVFYHARYKGQRLSTNGRKGAAILRLRKPKRTRKRKDCEKKGNLESNKTTTINKARQKLDYISRSALRRSAIAVLSCILEALFQSHPWPCFS